MESVSKKLINAGWQVIDKNYGMQIAMDLFSHEMNQLSDLLISTPINLEKHLIQSGGNKSPYTKELEEKFNRIGWKKDNISITRKTSFKNLNITNEVDAVSHEIDHLIVNKEQKCIAMEIEWNTHKVFMNRDTQFWQEGWNFGAIDLAILITKSEFLQNNLQQNIYNFFKENLTDIEELEERKFSERMQREKSIKLNYPSSNQYKTIKKNISNGKDLIEEVSKNFYSHKYSGTAGVKELKKVLEKGYLGRTPFIVLGIPDIKKSSF